MKFIIFFLILASAKSESTNNWKRNGKIDRAKIFLHGTKFSENLILWQNTKECHKCSWIRWSIKLTILRSQWGPFSVPLFCTIFGFCILKIRRSDSYCLFSLKQFLTSGWDLMRILKYDDQIRCQTSSISDRIKF